MPYVLVHHRVQDYSKWKPVYDDHQKVRKSVGFICEQLFRSTDDPNDLTILFEVSDLKKAREFAESEDLKDTMQRSGVLDVDLTFLEEIETHELVRGHM